MTASALAFGSLLLPGGRLTSLLGNKRAAAGLLILQALAADTNYVTIILPALVVMGLGAGLVYTAAASQNGISHWGDARAVVSPTGTGPAPT